jgi:hypothetical protein
MVASAIAVLSLVNPTPYVPADEPAKYIGTDACAACHGTLFDIWKSSHHAQAMQPATATTVLGDFSDASLEHFGVTTTFFHNGDKFMVHTDGQDGAFHDYPIATRSGFILCSNI